MIRFGKIFKFSVCSPTGGECKPSPTEPILSAITLQHISPRNRVSQRRLRNPRPTLRPLPLHRPSHRQRRWTHPATPHQIDGDDFWLTWSENVDGLGSSLNEYARRALVSALCYGHSGILVDFPPDPGVTTLFEERQLGRRPYFNHIDAYQIWGWRQESPIPNSPLNPIRLHEFATVPEGKFGQTRVERMRVIYPEKYEVYQRNGEVYGDTSPVGTQDIGLIETGNLPFNQIPFVPIYTNRTGMLTSSPAPH